MDNKKILTQLAGLLEANRKEIELANTQDTLTSHTTNCENMDRGLATVRSYANMDFKANESCTGVAIYSCYGDPSFGLFGMTLAPALLACGIDSPIIIGFPSILIKYKEVVERIFQKNDLFSNVSFVLGRRSFCRAIEEEELIRDIIIFGDSWISNCMRKAIGDKKRMVFYGPGNNASVILSGADYKTAIKKTLDAAFILNGQAAVCVNRCIIDNRIDKEEIRGLFEEALSKIKFGTDEMNPENYVTPIKIKPLVELTNKMVREGLNDQVSLINYKLEEYDDATLMHPSLVWNCACDTKLFKYYHFTPVLPVCFSDIESIASKVNDTDFGIYTNYWGNVDDIMSLKADTESKHIMTLENESILDVISPKKGYDGSWGGFNNSGFILNENTSWKPLQGSFQLIKILLQK